MRAPVSNLCIVCVILFTSPLAAFAAEATPQLDVDAEISRAELAYRELELEAAAQILTGVLAYEQTTPTQRFYGHLLNGMVHRILGNDTDARLSFLYVLRRSPNAELLPDAPPKVQTFFELVRDEVTGGPAAGKAARGTVVVRSTPPGLALSSPAGAVGTSPARITANAPLLHLSVQVPGGATVSFDVPVAVDAETVVEVAADVALVTRQQREDHEEARSSYWIWLFTKAGVAVVGGAGFGVGAYLLTSGVHNRSTAESVAGGAGVAVGGALLLGGAGLALWDLVGGGPRDPTARRYHIVRVTGPGGVAEDHVYSARGAPATL